MDSIKTDPQAEVSKDQRPAFLQDELSDRLDLWRGSYKAIEGLPLKKKLLHTTPMMGI